MKNQKKKWIIIGAVIVLAAVAFFVWQANRAPKQTYQEFKVERGDLALTIVSTGTVQPENRLEIKPPIAGRIDRVLIKEGQKVAKGQILAWMSSTERAALLDAARSKSEEEVTKWEDLYRATPVLAPLGGTIILRNIEAGQTVTNTDAILVMSDRLIVKALVDETDMAQVKLKQKAEVVLDAYSAEETSATVDQIAFEAKTTNNVTTYDIDVLPDKTPLFMRAGMTASVTFMIESRKDILLVPTEAIQFQGNTPTVMVKDAANPKAPPVEQKIKLGISDGKQSEVLEGLQDGQIVYVAKIQPKDKTAANPFGPPKISKKGKMK